MTRPAGRAILVGLVGLVLLPAGCGTAPHHVRADGVARPASLSLATAFTNAAGTWAVAVAGGSAAKHDNFWQLLRRPGTSRNWRLVTPPGVASNGGIIIAAAGTQKLTAAFRPSQDLTFTPLAVTTDLGLRWSAGVLDADLASTPGSLAADSATGHMLALLASGAVEQSSNRGATWTLLTTYQAVSRTIAGRACGLRNLTSVAFSSAGEPLLGGVCGRPGTVPIFAFTGRGWQAAGSATLLAAAGRPVSVLTMTSVGGRTTALLVTGAGPGSVLTAAWSATNGNVTSDWVLSSPQPLRGANLVSASSGRGGTLAVVLSGRAGLIEPAPGAAWRPLPQLPARTQIVASGPGATIEAIAAAGSVITIWAVGQASASWTRVQELAVPVQYGSSG